MNYEFRVCYKNGKTKLVAMSAQTGVHAQIEATNYLKQENLLEIKWAGIIKVENIIPLDIVGLIPKFMECYPDGLPYTITTSCEPDIYKKKFASYDEAKIYAIKLMVSSKTKSEFKSSQLVYCDGPGLDGSCSLHHGCNGEWFFSGGW